MRIELKIKDFDYKAISKPDMYFLLTLYYYRKQVLTDVEKGRFLIGRTSFYWDSEKAYNTAIKLRQKYLIIKYIVDVVGKVIDNPDAYSIMVTKFKGNKEYGGSDRSFFRRRNKIFSDFAYKLAVQGLNSKWLKTLKVKDLFQNWWQVARELYTIEYRNHFKKE